MKTPKIITIALLVCVGIFSCEKDSSDNAAPNGEGCTDLLALNYDSLATVDDGSCEYDPDLLGCTNDLSFNYDPEATVDDGSCICWVGMEAYGGIVAIVDESGTSGLVVAASDYTTGQTFISTSNFGWEQADVISLCETLELNGYNDWFVPSVEQLSMIYVYLHLSGIGGFTSSDYLTSETEDRTTTDPVGGQYDFVAPVSVDFYNGDADSYSFNPFDSSNLWAFRPVRYFP